MVTSINTEQITGNNDITKRRDDWHIVKFGDVIRNVQINVDPQESDLKRYIAGEHMETDDLHIRRWGTIGDGYLGPAFHRKFVKGQVLYGSRRTYLRKVAVAEFDGICANTTFVLEPDGNELIPELLPFIMQTEPFTQHSIKQSKGSVNPYINWKDIAWYEFALPPKDEQRRIADILWAVDTTITKWEQAFQEAASLRSTLIENSTLNNDEHYNLSGSLAKKYQIVKLHEVCKKITDGTHLPPEFVADGIPFLLVSNLASGKVDWNVSKWITRETYEELTKRTKPEIGDVLYTVVGSFGVPVLITWDQPFSFQRHIAILKPKKDLLDGAYLTYFLESQSGKKQAELMAVGNAQKTITLKDLNNFLIPLPSLNEQRQIVGRVNEIDNTMILGSRHIEISKQLKTEALRQLITGG